MEYYQDIREFAKFLEENDKLVRVSRKINKDTELMPLVRWQYRGLPEEQRKAFLFENVTDAKGKTYRGSVLWSGLIVASTEVYAMGMMCEPDKITEKWAYAQSHPIEPKLVEKGVCQEEVHVGESLLEHGGLKSFLLPFQLRGLTPPPSSLRATG